MGKTEKGALFLDSEMTSPYDFFQYWRNVPDQDVGKFLRIFTFMPEEEVQAFASLEGEDINRAKETLAYEFTKLIHGKDQAELAMGTARSAFGAAGAGQDISAMPNMALSHAEIETGIGVLELFARTSLCTSRGEARRLVNQGGCRVGELLITDPEYLVTADDFDDQKVLILRAGKKRFFRIDLV
jgi:tyrosyl-tRNA synthetase